MTITSHQKNYCDEYKIFCKKFRVNNKDSCEILGLKPRTTYMMMAGYNNVRKHQLDKLKLGYYAFLKKQLKILKSEIETDVL